MTRIVESDARAPTLTVGLLRHLDGTTVDDAARGYVLSTPVLRTTATHLQWLTRTVLVGRAAVNEGSTTTDIRAVGA